MLLARRLVDCLGGRLLAPPVALFGPAGALPGQAATPAKLAAALLLLGAASGFMDIVMNARVNRREVQHGTYLVHLAHGTYAAAFLAAVLTGLARDAGASSTLLRAAAGTLTLALAAAARDGKGCHPARLAAREEDRASHRHRLPLAVVLLGLIGFVALSAEPGLLELAVAAGRFAAQALVRRVGDVGLLAGGASLGTIDAAAFALAPNPAVGIAGLTAAGAGLSVLVPTAPSLAGRRALSERRGADVAAATIIGYAGLFVGPAVPGAVAARFGPPAAILVIAGLLLEATLPALALRRVGRSDEAGATL